MSGRAPRLRAAWTRPWAVVGIGILAALAGWLATASFQQDFAAYYTAATARARGLDPYLNYLAAPSGPWDGISVYRHSRFLYPPLCADLFRPLAALPYAWAKAIFTLLSVVALLAGLGWVWRQDGRRVGSQASWRDAVSGVVSTGCPGLLAIWAPVFVALERGQIDFLVLAFLAGAWRWRTRPLVAGSLLALAIMAKPLVLGVLPLMACARRWTWIAATVGAVVLLGSANVAVSGLKLSGEYVREVLPRAAQYGEGGPEEQLLDDATLARVSEDLAAGVARIDGAGRAYPQEIGTFRRNASLPRLLAGDGVPPIGICIAVYLALVAALVPGAWRRPDAAAWYWGALVAAVVASPVSWAMSLVLALPVVSLGLSGPRPSPGIIIVLGVVLAAGMTGPLGAGAWVVAGIAAAIAAAMLTLRSEAVP